MKTDRIILTEALKQWCDPQLVRRVETEERSYSAYEMNSTSFFQLTPQTQRKPTARHSWKVGSDFSDLSAAWKDLKQDFRGRVRRGQIHLEGVQTKPERRTVPEPIPSTWAGDLQFDFEAEAVLVDGFRFGAVTCSLEPPGETASTQNAASDAAVGAPAVREADVPALDDETIPARLNENHQRVAKSSNGTILPALGSEASHPMAANPPVMATMDAFDVATLTADQVGALPERLDVMPQSAHSEAERSEARATPRRGGRRSDIPIIEEALCKYLHEAPPGGPLEQPPVWTQLARTLRKQMLRRQAGQLGGRVPSEDTIRKHLPKIYARILGETPLGRPIAQKITVREDGSKD